MTINNGNKLIQNKLSAVFFPYISKLMCLLMVSILRTCFKPYYLKNDVNRLNSLKDIHVFFSRWPFGTPLYVCLTMILMFLFIKLFLVDKENLISMMDNLFMFLTYFLVCIIRLFYLNKNLS
jgi:hypothetical protein